MIQHHGGSQDRAERIRKVLSGNRRRRAMHRLEHRSLSRMDVSTRCHSQATLQSGSEVGDDVAEHIVSDDNIELPRIAHHLHA